MSTLLLERERVAGAGQAEDGLPGTRLAGFRGRPTLDDLITSVWEGLGAREAVGCPACGGAMVPRYSAGAVPVGGVCRSCGSELS